MRGGAPKNNAYGEFVRDNYARFVQANPKLEAAEVIKLIAKEYQKHHVVEPRVNNKTKAELVSELAAHRDRWQVLTSRGQDLDNDLSRMTVDGLLDRLEWYRSEDAHRLMCEWLDGMVDWERYYKDHAFLKDRPLLKSRRTIPDIHRYFTVCRQGQRQRRDDDGGSSPHTSSRPTPHVIKPNK